MKFLKDVGFVIRRNNLGESDRYVTIYTKDNGKIETLARGVRKITSKRASYIELLNLIRFQTVKTKKNNILTEVALVSSFQGGEGSLSEYSSVFLICELIDRLCPLAQKNENIYNLISETLKRIGKDESQEIIYDFELKLITDLGYWDEKRSFKNEFDLKNFIEGILEKKIKTKLYFGV